MCFVFILFLTLKMQLYINVAVVIKELHFNCLKWKTLIGSTQLKMSLRCYKDRQIYDSVELFFLQILTAKMKFIKNLDYTLDPLSSNLYSICTVG